ncbi:CBS domain-containing protein [Halobium salinum]|uniref:CBS domain-containing protein n=1 Tax=Halobium salinum TaxID=1364940 RepID=A0ABD5PAK1_9EURY|nr:CBS domain-containing protein [Halobium salinum]
MSTPLETIPEDATVTEAVRVMREHDIKALLVTSGPPGIVTATDVLDAIADGRELATLTVADLMTTPVETVPPDLLLEEVAAMMTSLGINHLPVVDGDPVGMVSSTDVTAQLS